MLNHPYRTLRAVFLTFSFLTVAHSSLSTTFYYTYGTEKGGVAACEVTALGQIKTRQILASDSLKEPKKLISSDAGDRLLVTTEAIPTAWIWQIGPNSKLLTELNLTLNTNAIAARGQHALVATDEGLFHWINLQLGQIEKTWNAKKELHPPGNKGESILFLPDNKTALIPFQKDSGKGKRFGSRLLVFDLEKLAPRFDLPLPRNHPELHIEGNLKEQGPNPEIAFVSTKSDTLALTLDLYGAVAFAKLSSALEGKWDRLDYYPTSLDGSWGTAFPDRGLLFEIAGKDYLLITNASPNGGLVLFDVAERKIVGKFPATAGCETPVFLPKSQRAVTVLSGKSKTRVPFKLVKETDPASTLMIFTLSPLAEGKEATLETIPFDQPVLRVEAVAPTQNDLLFLVLGKPEAESELLIYDLSQREILQRQPAGGAVSRITVYRDEK